MEVPENQTQFSEGQKVLEKLTGGEHSPVRVVAIVKVVVCPKSKKNRLLDDRSRNQIHPVWYSIPRERKGVPVDSEHDRTEDENRSQEGEETMLREVTHKRHGRARPYSEAGIRRLPCYRCGAPATQQWNICSDGGQFHPVCTKCDIALNSLVLGFMGHPEYDVLMSKYTERMLK